MKKFNIGDDVRFLPSRNAIHRMSGVIRRIDDENKKYLIRIDNYPFNIWINFDDSTLTIDDT